MDCISYTYFKLIFLLQHLIYAHKYNDINMWVNSFLFFKNLMEF